MDHLPLPKHPVCQPPLVRLYENCAYDGGPLDNYLERRNTSERALVDQLSSDAADNLAAHGILQNWTFFGVICVTTGAPSAAVAQLRRKADSQWVVDTSRLPAFVHTWMSSVRAHNLPALQRRDMEARFVQFLNKMFAVYDKIEIMLKDRGRLDSMLRLSVALLYDYLYRASTFAFGPSDWVRPHLQVAAVDCMRPLLLQMTRNGWCEGEIQSTQTMCNLIDLWFVGFLDHPHPEKDHIGCTKSRCIAYQIDERDYRTKHTTDHCSCPYVYAAQDRLSSILLSSSEAVPVIRPGSLQTPKGRGGTAGCYVEVLSSHSAGHVLPYVAISHLWSDGLGNNQENAIPECQFRRLSNFVTELCGEPVCFWLDTLCFPLQPKEAYDVALIRMKETYEAASKVLVLDQSLTPVSAGGISREEIIARILVCPWNRRLWTLQEAQLSPTRELYFQFKEGAVSGLPLLQHIGAYGPLPDHQKFERSFAVNFYFTFQNLCGKKLKTESLRGVLTAKEALAFRSTSNAIDEGLCLGNLLGWDVKPLVDTIDRQERMRVFWDLVGQNTGTQHASVLFWPSPKLSVPGYRWAPATFMDADMDDTGFACYATRFRN
ncbi:hypothetical protein BHE90_016186 [Fusarium euwallaceae]|uniref:Heterokaryon incompatibility domain-containing protein n=1 Tax=Fusarium euwallaceae TaxID=1147111 RepID=A0A430L146_9HYPO|nr:hypothetical protein BHE90_016186 [Fusarium euwallaceae]